MRTLVALVLLAVPLLSLAAGDVKVTADQVKALGIETSGLTGQAVAQIAGLPALVVVPNEQLYVVSTPLAGLLERVLVAVHQAVRKGQLLARVQSPELADLQHTFLQAETQARLARAELERDQALHADGIISESRLLATRSRAIEASADLSERTEALRLAGMAPAAIERLRKGQRVGALIELVSPLDGVVLDQVAVTGQRLGAAEPVLKVARLSPLWLEIQLPVARLAEVRQGAEAAVPALRASGQVIAIGRSVVSANQTVLVRARIDRGAEQLRPGQYVEASLALGAEGHRWSLPAEALTRMAGKPVVFVQTADGFRAEPVAVLGESAGRAVIGGLKGDEQVAVKGVAALKAALAGIGAE